MQLEMVESWYRTTLFYFYDKARNAQVIKQFLVWDRWGLHIEPRDFMCRIQIALSADNKMHGHCSGCDFSTAGKQLTRPLTNLHQLPNHVQFFIRIHTFGALDTSCLKPEDLRSAIDVLGQHLYDLQKAGHRFLVEWTERQGLELSSKTAKFPYDAWKEQLLSTRLVKPRRGMAV
jgi:hypothetical protein